MVNALFAWVVDPLHDLQTVADQLQVSVLRKLKQNRVNVFIKVQCFWIWVLLEFLHPCCYGLFLTICCILDNSLLDILILVMALCWWGWVCQLLKFLACKPNTRVQFVVEDQLNDLGDHQFTINDFDVLFGGHLHVAPNLRVGFVQ